MKSALLKKVLVTILVVLGLAGVGGLAGFVKLGEFTFAQHVMRIARTPAARELGDGILEKFTAAQSAMKSQIKAQLAASRERPSESEESEAP